MKRYQECNKLQQLWRRRWYLAVPFVACYKYITKERIYKDEEVDGVWTHTNEYDLISYHQWYRIVIGEMQIKMNYTYTMEEVEQHTQEWFENKKDEKI